MNWWRQPTPEARAEAEGYHCGSRGCGSLNFPAGYTTPPKPNQAAFDKGYDRAMAERKASS